MNKNARIVVWLLFIFGGIALSLWLDSRLFAADFFPEKARMLLGISGGVLFILAFYATGNVGRTLARHGRQAKDLPRMQTDRLVTTGIYRMMRHPMNQVLLSFPLSIALMLASPSFLFIIAPAEILAMLLMIRTIEEVETRKKFGRDYDEYCARTPRFCFRLECLKALLQNPDGRGSDTKD
jgi:protein-S-isoprenylcysteine O-methyltransferase Ste14